MTEQATQCHSCGTIHPTGAGYVRRKGRVLCSPCAAAAADRKAGRTGLVVWAVFLATALTWMIDAPALLRAILTILSLVWAAGVAITVVHEAGHALTALALGVRVRGIELGAEGPDVVSFTRGLFTVRIRLLPIGGLTIIEDATRAVRARHIVITAAGPLVQLAALIGIWYWHPEGWLFSTFRSHLLVLGALGFVVNLIIPLPGRGNDGFTIWRLLTMHDDEIDVMAGVSKHDEIVRRLNDHITGEPLSVDEFQEIRQFFLERLAHPGLPKEGRALESSNLAAVDVMMGRTELLEEADELSRLAYETMPIPAIAANRGSVLVALGQDTEGVELLVRTLPQLDPCDADSTQANLALAALRAGDVFAARRYLAAIRQDLNLPAYREARRLLGPAELRNVLTMYWTADRSAERVAALVVHDAGLWSADIARSIRRFAASTTPEDLVALFREHAHLEIEPQDASAQLTSLVDALTA